MEFGDVIRNRRMVRSFTSLPIGAVAVGHPDPARDQGGSSRVIKRKGLDQLVHYGRW